jgi:hypothetical protein
MMNKVSAARTEAALILKLPYANKVRGSSFSFRYQSESDDHLPPETGSCTACPPQPVSACEEPCCVGTSLSAEGIHNATGFDTPRV